MQWLMYVYPNWIYIHERGAMTSSTVFTSNRSQAVRLPKAVAFPEDVHQVDILKIGRSRVIVPLGERWDDLFQNGERGPYSHSIVPGGLLVTSYTTRLTPFTSLMIRVAVAPRNFMSTGRSPRSCRRW